MNKYYRNLILGFFLMLALFLFNLSATFSYSFLNTKQYIQIIETSGSIIALQEELIETLEQTTERINLSCDISECLSVDSIYDIIYKRLRNKNSNDLTLDCNWETRIQQTYEMNHWQFNSDKIKELAIDGISQINQRINNHLIFFMADSAVKINPIFLGISVVLLLVCSVIYLILHRNKKLCCSIVFSTILIQLILIGLLSLEMMNRITIGYGMQSAYMFFQALLTQWKTGLWIVTFIDLGFLLLFVKTIFLKGKRR
ncbi:hypothetical protein [Holdemania massiliensis]|uniref:hypothetical protein n=1 Tax=Holdemania massiliensis TaxID=1468449 RepID=UPI001F064E2B|nr:hypothetical protein [Holdemania massiliensis]MCH1939641.1 hypothetical protein [Holdemania massiliensis]